MVEVFAVDRRHDGNDGRQQEKRAIAFVRLDDEIVAFPQPRRRPDLIHPPADDKSWVEMRRR